ncbi:methyl-accepting chemotaxis sensory transducer, partial [Candidatus Magnetomorum sp. HK-1]
MTKLWEYVEWFIPQNMKEDLKYFIRARQFVLFSGIALLFYLVNTIKWFKLGYPNLAISMISVCIVNILMVFIFRVSGSINLAGNGVMAALCWHFFYLIYLTGGLHSSAISWVVIIPVFA